MHIYSVHYDKVNHKCGLCGNRFSQANNLKQHIDAVHNRQKDHKCESCGKAFSRASKLKMHIKSVHINQKCDYCKKKFNRRSVLRHHILQVHCDISYWFMEQMKNENSWAKKIIEKEYLTAEFKIKKGHSYELSEKIKINKKEEDIKK